MHVMSAKTKRLA